MRWLQNTSKAFARPFGMLRRHRLMVVAGLACLPIHAAVLLWMPSLMGGMIDSLDQGTATSALLRNTCLLLLGLALAESGSRYISRRLLIDASRLVERELKEAVLTHLQRLPTSWFDRARTGDLVSRLTQDVELIRFVMGPLLLHGGSTLCLLPAGIYLMAQMDVPVTLSFLGLFGVMFVFLRIIVPHLYKWSKASQEAIGALSQRAQEDFAGIRVLQQFAAQDRELGAMATRNRRYLASNLRLVRLRALINAATHSTTGAVTLAVLLVGGHQIIDGTLTVGELFQFLIYLGLLMMPIEILGWTLATMPRALAAGTRVEELFEVEAEDPSGTQPDLRGHLVVRDLTFTYPGAEAPALQQVSFELQPGQKLGLVGPVGSGKSTILALCLRLYEPPRGSIFLDGHDILDIAPEHVRSLFATAPQEPFLFTDTLAANVEFGRDTTTSTEPATDGVLPEIEDALTAAALDQDLSMLPSGIETIVGERGVILSGGQRQRASLARALFSERPALVLDDTLSAVDPHTEQRILEGLRKTRAGRTMIVATHRLSVIRDADLILVLEDGQVRERGTHPTLRSSKGLYAAAWRRQSEAQALSGEDQ
ncbi:MAG: ABC transporter ATP-binding protein [Planctomycetota bacterium]|nr:ABC transporter ATP-binding protein [Planctomycetota bacterium]